MIVRRHTQTTKVGQTGEMVKALKNWLKLLGFPGRVYTYAGTYEKTAIDFEFESREDMDKRWKNADWSSPSIKEASKKVNELREPGTTKEILKVH